MSYDFNQLCSPHYKALLAYANRLLPGRKADIADLVQEAFLRAFQRWESWSPRAHEDPSKAARGWLHRIVQNVFIDGIRARDGHRKLLDEHQDTVIAHTYGVTTDFDEQEIGDGLGDDVRLALECLDPQQRAVVVLADLQGEPYAAISAQLGIPMGTVMSRLHRARKRMAGALRAYAKTDYGINSDGASATTLPGVPPELDVTSEVDGSRLCSDRVVLETTKGDITISA